jgi:hypothetical protein
MVDKLWEVLVVVLVVVMRVQAEVVVARVAEVIS